MRTITVKEVLKITADCSVLNNEDRLVVTCDYEGTEYKVTIPWRDFENEDQFKLILDEVINNIKPKSEVVNMTSQWKGVYNL